MPSVISPIDPHGLRRNCVNLTQFLLCGFLGSTGANMSRVWGGTAFAQRSNESPGGAFKRQRGLRQQMEGPRSDKFYKCFRIVKA